LATQVPWIDNRVLHTPIVSVEKRIQGMDSALSYMPLTLEISRKWIYAILGGFSSILPLGLSLYWFWNPILWGYFFHHGKRGIGSFTMHQTAELIWMEPLENSVISTSSKKRL